MSDGVARIAAERARQVSAEGYDARHDDEHDHGELALAAVCYAAPVRVYVHGDHGQYMVFEDPWPWEWPYDKRRPAGRQTTAHRIRLLEKAGALVAAEIDRLLRLKGRAARPQPKKVTP